MMGERSPIEDFWRETEALGSTPLDDDDALERLLEAHRRLIYRELDVRGVMLPEITELLDGVEVNRCEHDCCVFVDVPLRAIWLVQAPPP